MTETRLAAEFRSWFMRELTIREGYCLACAAQVVTAGPRGGKVWDFEGHRPDCLFTRVHNALNRGETS